MSSIINGRKVDLRPRRTESAISSALLALLKRKNFTRITVTDICEEAFISRPTFYAYYVDRYDLLKNWLVDFIPTTIYEESSYTKTEELINRFAHEHKTIFVHLIENADQETLGILFDFLLSTFKTTTEEKSVGKRNPRYTVLSSFYAGGMLFYMLWHTSNRFPEDVAVMNPDLFDIIQKFKEWEGVR